MKSYLIELPIAALSSILLNSIKLNEAAAAINVIVFIYTAASVELMKLMKLIAAATIEWIELMNSMNSMKVNPQLQPFNAAIAAIELVDAAVIL